MNKRENLLLVFVFLLITSIILFLLAQRGLLSGTEEILQRSASPFAGFFSFSKKDALGSDAKLIKQLVDQKTIERENQALRDQFATALPAQLNLLPAHIIGMPGFLPGVSLPSYLILDKGSKDAVGVGFAVLYKDNVVGKIVKTTNAWSKILLLGNPSSTFTAKSLTTNALGVVKGEGELDLIFGNVLLSEKLDVGDFIVTKGDMDDGGGYPPNLIVGEIIAIDKKASSLFQSARLKSLLDFTKLSTVFVVLGYR